MTDLHNLILERLAEIGSEMALPGDDFEVFVDHPPDRDYRLWIEYGTPGVLAVLSQRVTGGYEWKMTEGGALGPEMEPFLALSVFAVENRWVFEYKHYGVQTMVDYFEYCKDQLRSKTKSATKE